MKILKLLSMLMFTLYWKDTGLPLQQGQKVKIICGRFQGKLGVVNYTWSDGSVDVLYGIKHYYVLDYHCLERISGDNR